MRIGIIGSGNMARALALGWGRHVTCSARTAKSAAALAELVGGTPVDSNAAVASASDVVFLCHKPAQLEEVAAEIRDQSPVIVSALAAVDIEQLRAAYPQSKVYRFMPNLPVEIRQGTTGMVDDDAGDPELFGRVRDLLGQLGDVVMIDDSEVDVLTAVSGVGPAYLAVVAEAQIRAAVAEGMTRERASELVGSTLRGSSALLQKRYMDTEQVAAEVASPGGLTEKGLAVLTEPLANLFAQAMDAVLGRKP